VLPHLQIYIVSRLNSLPLILKQQFEFSGACIRHVCSSVTTQHSILNSLTALHDSLPESRDVSWSPPRAKGSERGICICTRMVKILICSNLTAENISLVLDRVRALHSGSAGPFSSLWVLRPPAPPLLRLLCSQPLNIFLCGQPEKDTEKDIEGMVGAERVRWVAVNELQTLGELTVLVYEPLTCSLKQREDIRNIAASGAYRGADLLISHSWPQDVLQFAEFK
jgi:hypothetical protein